MADSRRKGNAGRSLDRPLQVPGGLNARSDSWHPAWLIGRTKGVQGPWRKSPIFSLSSCAPKSPASSSTTAAHGKPTGPVEDRDATAGAIRERDDARRTDEVRARHEDDVRDAELADNVQRNIDLSTDAVFDPDLPRGSIIDIVI